MKRALRLLLWLTGSLLVLVLLAVAALPRVLDINAHRAPLEAQMSKLLGRPVTIESLSLDLSHGVGVRAQHFELAAPEGRGEPLRIEAVTFVIKLTPYLFDDRIELAGLHLERPSLRIERGGGPIDLARLLTPDAEGKTQGPEGGWRERIEHLLQNAPIEFLRIEDGRLLLVSQRGPSPIAPSQSDLPVLRAGPLVTQISEISLNISSLRPYTPIEFELAGLIEPGGGMPGEFKIEGSWTFLSSDYHLDDAQLALRARFADIDTTWFHGLAAWDELGLDRGRVSGKLSLVGTPFCDLSGEGELIGRNVEGRWPTLWTAPFRPKTLRLPFEFERHEGLYELRLKHADINDMDVRRMRMTFAFDDQAPGQYDFAMDLEVQDVLWEKDFEFYPWSKLDNPLRDDLRERIERTGGADYVFVTEQAHYNGENFITDWEHTRIEADVRDMRMRVGRDADGPVLTDLTGKLLFQNGGLLFDHMDGRVDGSLALQFNGGFPRLVNDSKLDLSVSGEVPLAELARVAPRYGFPALRRAFAPMRQGSGLLDARAHLSFDLSAGEFNYQGELRFHGLEVPLPALGLDLSKLQGEVLFSHDHLESGLLRAQVGDSPVRFSFAVGTPQGVKPEFRLSFDGEDLPLAPLLSAWLGEKGYRGEGRLSLREFEVHAPAAAAEPVQVSGEVHIQQARIEAPYLKTPLKDLNCIFLLSAAGKNDFGCRALYGISDFKLSGTVSDEPGSGPAAYLELKSLYLDFDNLRAGLDPSALPEALPSAVYQDQPEPTDPAQEPRRLHVAQEVTQGVELETVEIAPSEAGPEIKPLGTSIVSPARLLTQGRIQLALSADSFQWGRLRGRNLSSTLAYSDKTITSDAVSFDGPGGRYQLLRARMDPLSPGPGYRVTIEPLLTGIEAGPLLGLLGGSPESVQGTLALDGTLSFHGRTGEEFVRTLGGQLRLQIANGRILQVEKFAILARILALVHWKRLEFKRLENYAAGVPFTEISGKFQIANGIARTNALVFESPEFDIRTSGSIDFPKQKLSLAAHMKITNPADFVIGKIPFVREVANALFVPIPIRGSWRDPEVRIEGRARRNPAN